MLHSCISGIGAVALLSWNLFLVNAEIPPWFPDTLPKSNARLEYEIPYPFEVVFRTWEGGPPDPQLIREEVQEEKKGNEIRKTKMIYTKNPFPFLIRKTVSPLCAVVDLRKPTLTFKLRHKLVRDAELAFIEVQHVNMKSKTAEYWSVNKCMEYVGKAYRASTLRQHPTKPGHTLIEQVGGVEVTASVPDALKGPVERFACRAFIDVCKNALDRLNVTLQNGGWDVNNASSQDADPKYSTNDRSMPVILQGLGVLLGGLCCKVLFTRFSHPAKEPPAPSNPQRKFLPQITISGSLPPVRAAAAAFAVALFSTQLLS